MALNFSEIKALYADGNRPETLKCIATPHKCRCDSDLEQNQLLNLGDLLQDTSEQIQLEQVQYIIDCLLCTQHQYKKYNHKNKVQKAWQREFQHLDFKPHRSPSPYSLYSGQSTPRRASIRSDNQSPNWTVSTTGSSISTSGSSTRADSVTSLSPPLQPNFRTPHARTVSEPVLPVSAHLVSGSDTSPAVYVNDAVVDVVQSFPRSPVATRSRRSGPAPAPQLRNVDSNQAYRLPPGQVLSSDGERDDANEAVPLEELAQQQEQNTESGRFEYGEASAWAPWTIRKACLQLIREPLLNPCLQLVREPLLNPRATGYIYAAQVKNINRTVVKIGKTYQDPEKRIKQIANEHQQEFNIGSMWCSPPVPALQLERLERLVHSDLAYFQRNWLVATDRGYKTHHEYFEVNLATAAETVTVWIDVTKQVGLKPGVAPNERLFESLYSDPALSVYVPDGSDSKEEWKRENEDHILRTNLWKDHLVSRSSRRRLWYKMAWWTCSSVALWLLLDMSSRTWYILMFFAIPSFMWDRFAGT